MKSLVGFTGFVGSNLREGGDFDALYNSKNIADAFGTSPDLLVYAGARAEMFLANAFPEKDFAQMRDALGNIKNIQPKKLVLISTISVYGENPAGDEDAAIDENTLTAYGRNRLWLENAARGECADALIVRLPALYGKNLKKNFIYDYIHVIPSLLKEEKFRELAAAGGSLNEFYERQGNGFYQCRKLMPEERRELAGFFKGCGFSALNFTDSRSRYQFYNLRFLWKHVCTALDYGIKTLNITAEPVSVSELHEFLSGVPFVNELPKPPVAQDLRTKHAGLFGGKSGYLFRRDFVLKDIRRFVEKQKTAEEMV